MDHHLPKRKLRASRSGPLGAALSVALLLGACDQAPERAEKKAETPAPARLEAKPAPVPIPGGIQLPDGGPLIHVQLPGPPGTKLPITGSEFAGFDVDPSTIANFDGFTAMAAFGGEAVGSDGKTYPMENDIRVYKGMYRAADGSEHNGVFAFIWIDLFEPGPGSQVHDFSGGLTPDGLFWTTLLPDDALEMSDDGKRATLRVENLPVTDSFEFLGANQIPATVSFEVTWEAKGELQDRGKGDSVPPTDPAAFSGRFSDATATGTFSGSEMGFSFSSKPETETVFAEMGTERNGSFLR